MVALDMRDYQNISQIFVFLFSLGIRRGNVQFAPKIGISEVQMGVTFE